MKEKHSFTLALIVVSFVISVFIFEGVRLKSVIVEPIKTEGKITGINTTRFNVGDTLVIDENNAGGWRYKRPDEVIGEYVYLGTVSKIDSTSWIPIDTVFVDTILNIINSNHYRWYKVEFVGSGGPMVIHGVWYNWNDSTATKFTITE